MDRPHWCRFVLVVGGIMMCALSACSSEEPWNGGTGGTGGSASSSGAGAGSSSGNGGASAPDAELTKFDLLSAGAGSDLQHEICQQAGQAADCDVCDALGFSGDLECDDSLIAAGLCTGPDPDCTLGQGDYFVAPNGDDAADGSEANPFATVQHAQDLAGAGDTIIIRGGSYQPTDVTQFTSVGTAAQPIILRSAPGEEVIIDGGKIPEGNTEGGSNPIWYFNGAQHWRIHGPLQLTQGRGSGVVIEGDTKDVTFAFIESSYNGQAAARAGHGFLIVEDEWANAEDVRFINCDAHHNANHRTKSGEPVADNLYQHGDGWRIKSGQGVALIGCRSWHNLDDNYDLVWAAHPVSLYQCWSGYAGRDDAQGSITGTPGFAADWGEGIKLGYNDDTGPHSAVRCLSFSNVHLGFRMDGGPYLLDNCASFDNGRRALGWELGPAHNVLHNNLDLNTLEASTIPDTTESTHNSWDAASSFTVAADDFLSLDTAPLLGSRSSDGSLPVVDFMRLVATSDLIDAGLVGSAPYSGAAPDVGCFERY